MSIIVISSLVFVAEHFIGFVYLEHPFLCIWLFPFWDDILMIFLHKIPPGILYLLEERIFRDP
jgi:hypothetical protein